MATVFITFSDPDSENPKEEEEEKEEEIAKVPQIIFHEGLLGFTVLVGLPLPRAGSESYHKNRYSSY